jgi:FecR protein
MNRTRIGFSLATVAAVILLLFAVVPRAAAQDQGDQDPPTRAGRLGYVQGAVSFQPGGQGDWLDAVPNRPLTTGDNLWADKDSRAEVQIGSTSIRLSSETSITFLDLGDNITQVRLSVGTVFFRVRHLRDGETFEVDTPNLAFNVYQPGEYRLDVNENGDQTTADVWRGDAEITGGGNSYRLNEGQHGTFSGVEQLSYDVGGLGAEDAFDVWCRGRDEREDHTQSGRYVSDDMTGYEDLDEYGRWHNENGYGEVWTPASVPYGWAPYRFGHWAYVWPWGWTWVEDEPWGFAPFHYGRWAFVGGGWCWVPGPVAVAPVYSPALVVFVGGGPAFGAGVGWFPLAPGEVYVPWYRTSPRYVQNINITNTRVTNVQVTNVYNNVTVNHVTNITYVNQRVNNGVTVVNRDTFVNARPVNNNIVRLNQREIAQAPVTHDVVRNIQPQRQSVMGAAHPVRMVPPAQALSRPVVATRQPVIPNRPAPQVAGFSRPTPPPVRTVRATAPTQAQPLERGARGKTTGMQNAGRPAPENNGGAAPRPNLPQNAPAARPGAEGPRPGTPENNNAPRPGANYPRPGAAQNNNARPPENPQAGRPNAPDYSGRSRNVPRPPSAQQERPQAQPEGPRGNPEAARPQPTRSESPRTMPEEPARPEGRPQPAPAPPPENRHITTPPPQNRQESAPRPETRTEPAPRPEARPAQPPPQRQARPTEPPQRESRPAEPRNERGNPPEKNDKEPPKSKFR